MKIFIIYQDLGYDGCIEPEKAFTNKELAESFINNEQDKYLRDTYRIKELDLE